MDGRDVLGRKERGFRHRGESLNLSSSLWVQNESRIVGRIIGAKPQKGLNGSPSMFWRRADYLTHYEGKSHHSLASEKTFVFIYC